MYAESLYSVPSVFSRAVRLNLTSPSDTRHARSASVRVSVVAEERSKIAKVVAKISSALYILL